MYVHGFRFYFTPLTGVLFAFPSRYWFTIGQSGVFSLGGWSPHIQTGY
ncbi:serine acetyltransferase, partial [Vibrio cholerae]